MGMKFNGGDCTMSSNVQSDTFFCEDFNGGPTTEDGDEFYIIVTSAKGDGTVYYNDWAIVGDNYFLDGGGDILAADSNITIYSSNITSPSNIVQTLRFDSSCSGNLFLKDRFGASQLVEWINVEQGTVTCFATAIIDVDILIPVFIAGDNITLASLQTITNLPARVNLTDDVFGETLTAGETLTVSFPFEIDLTISRRYTFLTSITGVSDLGIVCDGRTFSSFIAGTPPPQVVPTMVPTSTPSRSIAPSPDPKTNACMLEAKISCAIVDDRDFGPCSGLTDPRDVTCIGELNPSRLSFQFTGGECPQDPQNYGCVMAGSGINGAQQVYVEVNNRPPFFFAGIVNTNEIFVAPGNYGDTIRIWIYTVVNGQRGVQVQRLTIPTACDPADDLTLTNVYGSLALTGFRNPAQGDQSIFQNVLLPSGIQNIGELEAIAQSAILQSAFRGGQPQEILPNDAPVPKGQILIVQRENSTINKQEKFEQDSTFNFSLRVSGIGTVSQLGCNDTATLSF
jgi:hypothetical protein